MTLVNEQWAKERARLEEELQRARHLEAMGRLAGGIAHDCNNLLSAIEGYAQLVLSALARDDPVREDVTEIVRAATRAAALTRQLLAVGSYSAKKPEILELTAVVRGVGRLLRRMLGDGQTLEIEHRSGQLFVEADQGQLEQVLLNLVLNARDAMPRGGTIRIRTEEAVLGADSGMTRLGPGRYARVAVLDTGAGMTSAVLERAFEPYFTTKDREGGTGLGLPTARAIVEQFGGVLVLESSPNAGTVATVYLPLGDTLSDART
jgi:signal transduction histidine kinase